MLINVQLSENGPITTMDDSELEKYEGVDTSDFRGDAHWIEYWLPGTWRQVAKEEEGYITNRVHRSVHMKLRTRPV